MYHHRVASKVIVADDLTFQRTHFRTAPPNIPRMYQHDTSSDEQDDLPLQNRSTIQKNELLKIAVLIALKTCTKETSHAIIDSDESCCVIPYISDFIHQPTPIQNTTLKGIAGGITALGRRTVQLNITQENKENIILIIDNVIYAPYCPIRLISLQQLHRQSKAKGHENSYFTNGRKYSNIISRGRYVHMRLPF
jgi:hypothetical protein